MFGINWTQEKGKLEISQGLKYIEIPFHYIHKNCPEAALKLI